MKSVFLDTGYMLALELANDQNHRAASKHWRSITKSLPLLVTTSYVFDEVVTFFNNRRHHAKAVEVGNRLLAVHPFGLCMWMKRCFVKVGSTCNNTRTKSIR